MVRGPLIGDGGNVFLGGIGVAAADGQALLGRVVDGDTGRGQGAIWAARHGAVEFQCLVHFHIEQVGITKSCLSRSRRMEHQSSPSNMMVMTG